MSNSPPTLLGVVPGVENKILLFVSSGKRGIRDVLNLRLVCSTTKLWVDRLPKKHADVVFSRAKIVVDLCHRSLRLFLSSPPAFKVSTLCVEELEEPDCENHDDIWARFRSYWNRKLETLELQGWDYTSRAVKLVLELMGSPNLLNISDGFVQPEESEPLGFNWDVTKYQARFFLPGNPWKRSFYLHLQRNRNLRDISIQLNRAEDLVAVSNLIELRKEDTHLKLNLRMTLQTFNFFASDSATPDYHRHRQLLQSFANSIIESKSKINLVDISRLEYFYKYMNELLPHAACLEFFKRVKFARNWRLSQNTLSILGHFSCLKTLLFVNTSDSSVEYNRLTWPPSLEKLEFTGGFAPLAYLPPKLKCLRLYKCKFVADRLGCSLNLIQSRCPDLRELTLNNCNFVAAEERGQAANFERSTPFFNLENLSITGVVHTEVNADEFRNSLTDEFYWTILHLRALHLSIRDSQGRDLPLVGEEILRGLLNGPSAKSIQSLFVPNGSVTPQALPLLKTLEAKVRK